jgi:hypothetical protein
MHKVMVRSIVGLLVVLLCACSGVSRANNGQIKPGDQVGDFVFSIGEVKIAGFPHNYSCTESGDALDCKTTAGTRVNISPSYYDDSFSGKIEQQWSESEHEMLIEGRQVSLPDFGYIDVPNPAVGSVRKWNVAMLTDKPGVIVVQHSGVFGGQPFQFTTTWTFTAP